MNIYIQSKSGDFNSSMGDSACKSLLQVMKRLREDGSYIVIHRGKQVEVPFEEIQFIKELEEND